MVEGAACERVSARNRTLSCVQSPNKQAQLGRTDYRIIVVWIGLERASQGDDELGPGVLFIVLTAASISVPHRSPQLSPVCSSSSN